MTAAWDHDGWQSRLADSIGEVEPPRYLIQARVPDSYRVMIATAARRRGMPVAAYVRRAILAFVAHDLGIDFLELTADEPAITEKEGLPPRKFRGSGFGPWRIRKLDR